MAQEPDSKGAKKSGNLIDELRQNAELAWKLMTDSRVSLISKVAIPLAGLIYFISPIDLIPDFIPILTQIDDVAIILLLVRLFIAMAPQDVVAEYRSAMGMGSSGRASSSKDSGAKASGGAKSNSAKPADDTVVDAEYRVVNE